MALVILSGLTLTLASRADESTSNDLNVSNEKNVLTSPTPESPWSRADEYQDGEFVSHITQTPIALPKWKVNFAPMPGAASPHSQFLFNSLNIGVGKDFEVGTVPLFYLFNSNWKSIVTKWTFVNRQEVQLGLGSSAFLNDQSISNYSFSIFSLTEALLVRYSPNLSKWSFGFNVAGGFTEMKMQGPQFNFNKTFTQKPHYFLDATFEAYNWLYISSGLSYSQNFEEMSLFGSFDEHYGLGYGGTVTFLWRGKFISQLGIGAHVVPQFSDYRNLVTVSFL